MQDHARFVTHTALHSQEAGTSPVKSRMRRAVSRPYSLAFQYWVQYLLTSDPNSSTVCNNASLTELEARQIIKRTLEPVASHACSGESTASAQHHDASIPRNVTFHITLPLISAMIDSSLPQVTKYSNTRTSKIKVSHTL